MGVVQDREEGEEEEGVAEADEAEKEGHIKLEGRGTDGAAFEGDGVGAVDDGGEEGEGVAKEELGGGFGGEGVRDGGVVSAGGGGAATASRSSPAARTESNELSSASAKRGAAE